MNENNTKKFAEERRRQQSNQARARETLKKQHETQLKLLLRSRDLVRRHATLDHIQLSELSLRTVRCAAQELEALSRSFQESKLTAKPETVI